MRNRLTKSKLYRALKREASQNRLYNTTGYNELKNRIYAGRGRGRKGGDLIYYIVVDSLKEYVEELETQFEEFEELINQISDKLDKSRHKLPVIRALELVDDIKTCVSDFYKYFLEYLQEVEAMGNPPLNWEDLERLKNEIRQVCNRFRKSYDILREFRKIVEPFERVGLDMSSDIEAVRDMLFAIIEKFKGIEFEFEDGVGLVQCSGIFTRKSKLYRAARRNFISDRYANQRHRGRFIKFYSETNTEVAHLREVCDNIYSHIHSIESNLDDVYGEFKDLEIHKKANLYEKGHFQNILDGMHKVQLMKEYCVKIDKILQSENGEFASLVNLAVLQNILDTIREYAMEIQTLVTRVKRIKRDQRLLEDDPFIEAIDTVNDSCDELVNYIDEEEIIHRDDHVEVYRLLRTEEVKNIIQSINAEVDEATQWVVKGNERELQRLLDELESN